MGRNTNVSCKHSDAKAFKSMFWNTLSTCNHGTKKDILGKWIFYVFPNNPNDTKATGVKSLRDSLHRVLKNKLPDTTAVQKYDIYRPDSEGNGVE